MTPRLFVKGLPKNEQGATATLAMSLGSLDNYVRDFRAALSLFDFAQRLSLDRENRDALQWCFIACRDGAMTIYHFGETLQNVRDALGSCPTVRSLADHKSLRLTSKKFDARFPDFRSLRHAVAHSSELWKNFASLIKNSLTGKHTGSILVVAKGTNIAIHNCLANREYSTTIDGRLVSYEISKATLERLISTRDEFYTAFRDVES